MNPKQIHDRIRTQALLDKNEQPGPYRKYLPLAIGLVLIVLFLTYLTPELLDYLQGRTATYEIRPDYTLYLKNGERVVFDAAVYEQLKTLYQITQTHEFKACLKGRKENFTYLIENLYLPQTYSESVYHITAEMCNSTTLISLHSHPPEHCVVSEQDLQSAKAFKQTNPNGLNAVMCGANRIGIYGE